MINCPHYIYIYYKVICKILKRKWINVESDNNYIRTESDSDSGKTNCSLCGQQFDDMAKMQRHMIIQRKNEGNIPQE